MTSLAMFSTRRFVFGTTLADDDDGCVVLVLMAFPWSFF